MTETEKKRSQENSNVEKVMAELARLLLKKIISQTRILEEVEEAKKNGNDPPVSGAPGTIISAFKNLRDYGIIEHGRDETNHRTTFLTSFGVGYALFVDTDLIDNLENLREIAKIKSKSLPLILGKWPKFEEKKVEELAQNRLRDALNRSIFTLDIRYRINSLNNINALRTFQVYDSGKEFNERMNIVFYNPFIAHNPDTVLELRITPVLYMDDLGDQSYIDKDWIKKVSEDDEIKKYMVNLFKSNIIKFDNIISNYSNGKKLIKEALEILK